MMALAILALTLLKAWFAFSPQTNGTSFFIKWVIGARIPTLFGIRLLMKLIPPKNTLTCWCFWVEQFVGWSSFFSKLVSILSLWGENQGTPLLLSTSQNCLDWLAFLHFQVIFQFFPFLWKMSSMYGLFLFKAMSWKIPTILDWKIFVAGLMCIGRPQHSKIQMEWRSSVVSEFSEWVG